MKTLHLVSEDVKVGAELKRRQARVDVQAVVSDAMHTACWMKKARKNPPSRLRPSSPPLR